MATSKVSAAHLMRRFAQAGRLRRQLEKIERGCREKLDELLAEAGGVDLKSAAGRYWLEKYQAHQWDTAGLQVLMDKGVVPKSLYKEVTRERPKVELKTFPSAKLRAGTPTRKAVAKKRAKVAA